MSSSVSSKKTMLTDADFVTLFEEVIDSVVSAIDAQDCESAFDVDFNNDVLSVAVDNLGTFVINKQTSIHEIWLSSPISGPHHFLYNTDGRWVSSNGVDMMLLLSNELGVII